MNDNRINEIKKEDKKAFKGFLLITVLGGVCGALFSVFEDKLKVIMGDNLSNFLLNILEQIAPYASIILSILAIIVSVMIYTKSKKQYEVWKERDEDDDDIDKIERNLSCVILVTSVNTILGFFFFGAGINLIILNDTHGELEIMKAILLLAGFMLCTASSILIQKNVVNLSKEINPLLKGSVYDSKFNEKWFESCDESIKLEIYKSSYKAFKSTSTACALLWGFCIAGSVLWNIGIMPLVMVSIIWLILTVSYCIESIRNPKTR